jgi:hypothetical protein
LAAYVGNADFDRLDPKVVTAISLHDAGWPLHDDDPTLNPHGQPIDVFESTRPIALKVWTASSERAEAVDPYAGLLVSFHGLALSVFAMSRARPNSPDVAAIQDKFAFNQFQHAEVERQERLRKILGLRTDLPLTYGLAKPGLDPAEDRLLHDFRMLRAMDLVSLALCCTAPPVPVTEDVYPRPGDAPLKFTLSRANPTTVTVNPWPFNRDHLQFTIPFRRVNAHPFDSLEAFRHAYHAAAVEQLSLAITHP